MNILIGNDNYGAHLYERIGLMNAFNKCGHSCYLWNIQNEPVHRVFTKVEPNIFIFQTYNLNRVIIEAIKERPHLKCIMKAGEWGHFSDGRDLNNYQILVASDNEKQMVRELKNKTGQPEYVYIYYHEDDIEETHGYWLQNGINIKSHLLAADTLIYTNGRKAKEFESEITFIGGYWPYKARVLEQYLIPMCRSHQYRIKIFGGSIWPTPYYCGFLQDKYTKDALSSAVVCPNLHEPHSQDFGFDINERTFKLMANKCFIVSDYVAGLRKLFSEDELLLAKNPKEFETLIKHAIEYPNEKEYYIAKAYKKVMEKHTYFDRIADIFTNLGFIEEGQKCLQYKTNLI